MSDDRVPLFVRLPRAQAAALDRMVGATGRRKQQLVSELLGDQLAVGRAEILSSDQAAEEQVLTLEEAAALLRVPVEAVREGASAGELPGRRLAQEWRFSRTALLAWLAAGESDEAARQAARADDRD
ncbi:MAG TPA: helix-turn-helix domain-containing protein [Solirubrobacteraceae bacterium]|nr:helix-turn-helix domain-containing protein [Solirubrobacteraceae bacterium]